MKTVNVLITTGLRGKPLSEEYQRKIAAISPVVKMTDVSSFITAEKKGDFSTKEEFDALLAEAEVIFGHSFPQNGIVRAPKLKWFQAMSTGIDYVFKTDPDIVRSRVIITNAHANVIGVSETILARILMFAKKAPLCFRLKQAKKWEWFKPTTLHSKTVGILGLGKVGREVARRAKAFGMRVLATRRSAKRKAHTRYVDVVFPRNQLPQLLSESDFVVLALPLTPETTNLLGEKELRTMKPTAYLINVDRGDIIDEKALIRALKEHWIAGAALDTFATEPLPTDSKFWELPNVIFSPHVGGGSEVSFEKRFCEPFLENLKRYLDGKKLLNIVDKKKGY